MDPEIVGLFFPHSFSFLLFRRGDLSSPRLAFPVSLPLRACLLLLGAEPFLSPFLFQQPPPSMVRTLRFPRGLSNILTNLPLALLTGGGFDAFRSAPLFLLLVGAASRSPLWPSQVPRPFLRSERFPFVLWLGSIVPPCAGNRSGLPPRLRDSGFSRVQDNRAFKSLFDGRLFSYMPMLTFSTLSLQSARTRLSGW